MNVQNNLVFQYCDSRYFCKKILRLLKIKNIMNKICFVSNF